MSGITLTEVASGTIPTPASGKDTIFVNVATGEPSYKDDAGAVHSLQGTGFADGDYGDIVISGGVTAINIDSGVLTTAARTVTDDVTVAAMVDTLGGASSTGTGGLVREGSPAFTGTPTAPTAAPNTNSTQLATTAYADAAAAAGYTTEQAQDAVGAMVDGSTLEYIDATPLLQVKDAGITNAKLATAAKTVGIPFIIDGGGAVIATGVKGDLSIPFSGTITGWVLLADQSGSIVIDTWKDVLANYPPDVTDTMWGTKPALSSATNNSATGLSIAVTAGDTIRYNVDSATTVTRVTLSLTMTKS